MEIYLMVEVQFMSGFVLPENIVNCITGLLCIGNSAIKFNEVADNRVKYELQ